MQADSNNLTVQSLQPLFNQMQDGTGRIDDDLLRNFINAFNTEFPNQPIYDGQQQNAEESYLKIINMLLTQNIDINGITVDIGERALSGVDVYERNISLEYYIGQITYSDNALTFNLHRDPQDNGLIAAPESLNVQEQNYTISSITVYAGTGQAGHYYVYNNLGNGVWIRLDNLSQQVTRTNFDEIQNEIATKATMVTYVRQQQNQLQMGGEQPVQQHMLNQQNQQTMFNQGNIQPQNGDQNSRQQNKLRMKYIPLEIIQRRLLYYWTNIFSFRKYLCL